MTRILIADDHAIVRSGLKQIVLNAPDLTVVGEATSSQELLTLARAQPWDLIILDIHMPGRGGLETLKDLKREFPKLPVLILSMYPEDQYAVRAIKAGAAGYLNKESAPDELLTAIHKVLKGGKYISPGVAEHLAMAFDSRSDKAPHELLSDREYQILCLIASGKTVGDIAGELNLSVKTVSTHRGRILDKMQMKSNAELTHYAIRNQLV
jgi:two-component system, NarL family, invasion response regulator UvrY